MAICSDKFVLAKLRDCLHSHAMLPDQTCHEIQLGSKPCQQALTHSHRCTVTTGAAAPDKVSMLLTAHRHAQAIREEPTALLYLYLLLSVQSEHMVLSPCHQTRW